MNGDREYDDLSNFLPSLSNLCCQALVRQGIMAISHGYQRTNVCSGGKMDGINYYSLLKDGVGVFPNLRWEEVVNSVIHHRKDLEDPDAAFEALYGVCLECSQDWVGRRTKIVKEASSNHSNPVLQSDYCLTALRELVYKASKQSARHDASPETVIVRRQVSHHLRGLEHNETLVAHMVRTKAGRDRFKLWGLRQWGEDWRSRKPDKPLEKVKKDLPIILANREGKGIFDYASILPTYLPKVLNAYGAALSTDEITSVICFRISPPLFRNPNTPTPFEEYDPFETYGHVASPEELMVEEQMGQKFLSLLTERELRIFKMSEEGMSVKQIAEEIGCAPRTVNNDRTTIFEKCRAALEI